MTERADDPVRRAARAEARRASRNGHRTPDEPQATPKAEPESADRRETAFNIFSAPDLARMELPDPRWAIPGILAEGLGFLAGKPKLGKSWLALNLGLAIAAGGVALGNIDVDRGPVLYLALEDTPRRLKARMAKLLSATQAEAPPDLTLATAWPRQDQGGLAALAEWLMCNKGSRLIIIDTWGKFCTTKKRGGNDYEQDVQITGEVKALADKFGIAVLVLHHCRKMPADDPFDSLLGTNGIAGSPDTLMVLRRERGQHDAALCVTGRDIDEQELALRWDPEFCLWSAMGEANEYRLSRERTEVLELMRKEGRPMKPAEIAALLDKNQGAVRKLLWSLKHQGWVTEDGKGSYVLDVFGR